jgi:geranylgeranyl reductase family protein
MLSLRLLTSVDADVVVVGAGPAGAATAAHLAAQGVSVLLLDQKHFPRDKVCGDFVGPVALDELALLGVSERPDYRRTNKIREAALFLDGRELILRSIPQVGQMAPYGRVIPRWQLDAWVVDAATAAGATLLEGHRVTHLETEPGRVRLTTRGDDGSERVLHARAVVGADGSNSQIARILRQATLAKEKRIIAVRAYYEGVSGPADRADLYFSASSFPGYYWLFPTSGSRANVGVGMVLATVPRTREHLRTLLLDLVESDKALAKRLGGAAIEGHVVGWPLTTYDPKVPIVTDRMLLVGDAAGLINPLNGEGIQYALLSARWAAQHLVDALAADDLSAPRLAGYEREVKDELRYDMALSQMIVGLIRNRTLNGVWLRLLRILVARAKVDPDYAEIAGGILAGLLPASDAVSRRMVIGTLEQAAVSLGIDGASGLVRNRKNLMALGMDPARLGYQLAHDALFHRKDTLEWGTSLPGAALELIGQAARDAVRRDDASIAPPAARTAHQ